MILQDYVNDRLDEGETNAVILGLQNNVRSNLADALKQVPEEDWHAEAKGERWTNAHLARRALRPQL